MLENTTRHAHAVQHGAEKLKRVCKETPFYHHQHPQRRNPFQNEYHQKKTASSFHDARVHHITPLLSGAYKSVSVATPAIHALKRHTAPIVGEADSARQQLSSRRNFSNLCPPNYLSGDCRSSLPMLRGALLDTPLPHRARAGRKVAGFARAHPGVGDDDRGSLRSCRDLGKQRDTPGMVKQRRISLKVAPADWVALCYSNTVHLYTRSIPGQQYNPTNKACSLV